MRIIVADDEYFARKALVKNIGQLDEEIECCEEAEDGTQVMELLEDHGADLVVTDIRMPDMDGLEVSRRIQEKFPDVSVIIESGYMDFDYATTAIRYGVKDYLTKPVKKEELEKAIERVKEERKKLKQKIEKQIEKQIAARRGQFMNFSHILENEAAANEILQEFFEKIEQDSWYLLTVQSEKKQLLREEIQNIQGIFEKESRICTAYFYPKNEFILAVQADEQNGFPDALIRRKIVECWHKAKIKCHAGVSQCHEKTTGFVKEMAKAYREAVYAINQRLLCPEDQIYHYEAEVNVVQLFSQAEERELEKSLMENRTQNAVQITLVFLKRCENNRSISIYSLFTSLIQLMNVINKVYSMKKDESYAESNTNSYLLFNFKTDLYSFYSMEELKEYMKDLILHVSDESEQKSSIINDLLKYLEWNYQYDITVNELAVHKYFVNPSYLSRLFKAETGMTFSRYLKELRMKKAAELLQESNLKIGDVACCVGYNDVSYFIQTFKKQYSMTPEQFKNSGKV